MRLGSEMVSPIAAVAFLIPTAHRRRRLPFARDVDATTIPAASGQRAH